MKKKLALIKFIVVSLLLVGSLYLIYRPSFDNYFWGDDLYNIWIAKASSLVEVAGFFNIFKKAGEFPFYRPLTTQLFFHLTTKNARTLDPLWAHVTIFTFFVMVGWLVWLLTKELFQNKNLAFLSSFFYLFSGSHFYRIYAVSQFQEWGLTFFFLLAVFGFVRYIFSKKKPWYYLSLASFILAFFCKESILTAGLILSLVLVFLQKLRSCWRALIPYYLVSLLYVLLRVVFFGFTTSGHYQLVFHPVKLINTYFWYGLWSLGFPEDLVNLELFKGSTIINPRVLISFGEAGSLALLVLILLVVLSLLGVKLWVDNLSKVRNRLTKPLFFGLLWFMATLLMVAFYPFHKFIYSLTLPLFGISLVLAVLSLQIWRFSKVFFFLYVFFYFHGQQFARSYAQETHWSIKRGILTKATYLYIDQYLPDVPVGSAFYVREFSEYACRDISYPLTREVEHALSQDKAVKLKYGEDKSMFYDYNTPIDKISLPAGQKLYEINVNDIIAIARTMKLKI